MALVSSTVGYPYASAALPLAGSDVAPGYGYGAYGLNRFGGYPYAGLYGAYGAYNGLYGGAYNGFYGGAYGAYTGFPAYNGLYGSALGYNGLYGGAYNRFGSVYGAPLVNSVAYL